MIELRLKKEVEEQLVNLIHRTIMNEDTYILLEMKETPYTEAVRDYPIISIEERLGAIKALKWVLKE